MSIADDEYDASDDNRYQVPAADDVGLALAHAEVAERLDEAIGAIEQQGYGVRRAVLVVGGELHCGEGFRVVSSTVPCGDELEVPRLLFWAVETVGRDLGLLGEDADGGEERR